MQGTVGGDFYDFPPAGADKVGLLIGDVMGHGVSSALLMAMIVGLIRRDPEATADPVVAARLVNNHLKEVGDAIGHVITCSLFCGVISPGERRLVFVNAGHPPPIVCNKSTCLLSGLGATAPLLGVVDSADIEAATHAFSHEDRITLYTDGVTDARNAEGEPFGYGRLHDVASRSIDLSPAALIDEIFAEVDRFLGGESASDDQSLVVIDFG